jgi:hypothetical protein
MREEKDFSMSDMDDTAGTLAARYSELVLLVRNLLALDDHGNFADGVGPDDRMFARAWVRAKVRQAVRPGVLHNESSDDGAPSPTGGPRSAPSTANPV